MGRRSCIRRSCMEWLEILAVLVLWSVLQAWVLPKFGVPT